MESLLLLIAIVLLLLDLDEHRACHEQLVRPTRASRLQDTSARIGRLTEQAVRDMLDEVRRHQPGPDERHAVVDETRPINPDKP